MDYLSLLGIDADADERAIKRAYAAQLKRTRPDEDPAGFQRLNEAYQEALYYARHTASEAWDTEVAEEETRIAVTDTVTAPTPATHEHDREASPAANTQRHADPVVADLRPSMPPPLPSLDPGLLVIQILTRARTDSPQSLKAYLDRHDGLYALATKRTVGHGIYEHVLEDEDPVTLDNLPVLATFFDFEKPRWLEERLRAHRAVAREDTRDFGEHTPLAVRQLKRRFLWPQAVLMASVPGLAARIDGLAMRLEQAACGPVPGIEPHQRAFFGRMADPLYFGLARWTSIILAGLVALCAMGFLVTRIDSPAQDRIFLCALAFLGAAGLLVGWHGVRLMHALRTAEPVRLAWAAPLAPVWPALLGLVLDCVPEVPGWVPYLFAVPAAMIFMARVFTALRMGTGVAWLALLVPQHVHGLTPGVAGFAGAAILMSVFDLAYAKRHALPLRAVGDNRWTYIGSYAVLALGLVIWFVATRIGA